MDGKRTVYPQKEEEKRKKTLHRIVFSDHNVSLLLCAHANQKGNLLPMNIIKTNEGRFLLWYKQLVISHEDSIMADYI